MDPTTRLLVGLGVTFLFLGLAWQMGWLQSLKLGHLPGDILIESDKYKFYFPFTTGIILSVVVTLLSWLI